MSYPYPQLNETPMSDNLTTHARSDDYVFRMPTPPRIVIPPLATWNHTENGGSDYSLGPLVSHSDPAVNIDFVDARECSKMVNDKNGHNWNYAMRREAQAILPFLYLGPYVAAKDKEFLRQEGITMVLGITPPGTGVLTIGAMKAAAELGIAKATIEVAQARELISVFPTAWRTINMHLREMHNRAQLNPAGGIPPGKVLIFCQTGCDISAGVAAAYLIETFAHMDYIKACQVCSTRRFSCAFDDNLKQLLRTYSDILHARRGVASSTEPSTSAGGQVQPVTDPFFGSPANVVAPQPLQPRALDVPSTLLNGGRAKRGREIDDSDSMDVDQNNMDEERFVGRNFTPFN
jgi:serine/threonine/tyrosine-interacting protein